MPEPVVAVEDLRKEFPVPGAPGLVAVDDVSFELERGESLAVIGESGSGKTTLARMLVGLETPTAGRIEIDGEDRSRPGRRARERLERGRRIQLVFQNPYSSLDRRQPARACIAEMLDLHFGLSPDERDARVRELCEQVGLDERQAGALPRALSGGQRQRVAIARALAVRPQVLVLDEAVASLDVSIQAQILNLLADIRAQEDISYIVVSHDLAVVRQISDKGFVMEHGRVVERGSTVDLLDAPQHPYTQLLRRSVPGPGWTPQRRQRGVHA
ncbi:MAG: ABC transporter ATP-binding protein [Thermoleophilaceae bacterium]|nr:ABC transporter ATP-binding protein [Thermoleophilaceae bacterium]